MNLRHETIKFRLRTKGTSLANIARQLEVTRSSVTQVSKGEETSDRIQRAIADALGDPVEELFPSHRAS